MTLQRFRSQTWTCAHRDQNSHHETRPRGEIKIALLKTLWSLCWREQYYIWSIAFFEEDSGWLWIFERITKSGRDYSEEMVWIEVQTNSRREHVETGSLIRLERLERDLNWDHENQAGTRMEEYCCIR